MSTQTFFAIRVTVVHVDGGSATRLYVRGAMRLSQQAFTSYAVGDLQGLVTGWAYGDCASVTIEPATQADVDADAARWGH